MPDYTLTCPVCGKEYDSMAMVREHVAAIHPDADVVLQMAGAKALYSGTCRECGGRWDPGDLIDLMRAEDGSVARIEGGPVWVHDACPDDDPLESPNPVCATCWLTHPEGACDVE